MNVGYNPTSKVNQNRPEFKAQFIGIVEHAADKKGLRVFMEMLQHQILTQTECNYAATSDLNDQIVRLAVDDFPELSQIGEDLVKIVNPKLKEIGVDAHILFLG